MSWDMELLENVKESLHTGNTGDHRATADNRVGDYIT